MGVSCAIHGCESKRHKEHISTFGLPRDPSLREQWLQNLPDYVNHKRTTVRICQLHFRNEDIIKFDRVIIDNEVREYPRKNYKLKSRAVPVFFHKMDNSERIICTSKSISREFDQRNGQHIHSNIESKKIREDSQSSTSSTHVYQNIQKHIPTKCKSTDYSKMESSALDPDPIITIQDISDRIEDVEQTSYNEDEKIVYNNEVIRNIDDIAEFYQICDDLQKNWIFLQEKNKAFLCNISMDTDIATMDGSACFFEDLSVVLAVKQEKITKDIPRYFKRIDNTDKLQDVMDFVMKLITESKKQNCLDEKIDKTSEQENIRTDHKRQIEKLLKENTMTDKTVEHKQVPQHIKKNTETKMIICEPDVKRIILKKELPQSTASQVIHKIQPDSKSEGKRSKETFDKERNPDISFDTESIISENENVDKNIETIILKEEHDDTVSDEEEEEIITESAIQDNKQNIADNESDRYEFTSDLASDTGDKENNVETRESECEDNDQADFVEYKDNTLENDYSDVKMETDDENNEQVVFEEEEEIDDLMGVMKSVNEWKSSKTENNMEYFYLKEDYLENKQNEEASEEISEDIELHYEQDNPDLPNEPENNMQQEDLQIEEDTEMQDREESSELEENKYKTAENGDNMKKEKTEHSAEMIIEIDHQIVDSNEEEFQEDSQYEDQEIGEEIEDDKQICCAECKVVFNDKARFIEHLTECEKEAGLPACFVCETCNAEFESEDDLRDHFVQVHDSKDKLSYDCMHCDKKFASRRSQFAHIKKHLTDMGLADEARVKEAYKTCEFCDKDFSSKSGYINHMKVKHNATEQVDVGATMYPCHQCDKKYRSAVELDGHINGHKGIKPYVCEVCHRSYQSKISLYTHSKTHTDEHKIYQCDQCEQTFTQKANCVNHMRLHTGEKPYVCEECGKGFTFIGLWKTHQRIHQGITPYGCPQCDKTFHDKSSLRKHQRRQDHPGEPIIDEKYIKISQYRKRNTQNKMYVEEKQVEREIES